MLVSVDLEKNNSLYIFFSFQTAKVAQFLVYYVKILNLGCQNFSDYLHLVHHNLI